MAGLIGSTTKSLRVKEFRTSGTFAVPSGVKTVSLFLVAGGGGGDTGGAGLGGNVVEVNYDVDGKASCAVIIGGGGGAGSEGGTTSFDGVVTAKGGMYASINSTAAAGTIGLAIASSGKHGFGGHGQSHTLKNAPMNGGGALSGTGTAQAPAANSGGGGAGGAANLGASGYARVEWYE